MNVMTSSHLVDASSPRIAKSSLLVDVGWVAFIFGAANGLRIVPIENPERYFWAPLDAIVFYFLIRQSRLFVGVLKENRAIALWPALAAASAIWSVLPSTSLYFGLQLLMTILAGVLLCLYADLQKILILLFIGLFLTALASLAVCLAHFSRAFGANGEWLGVFPHKNFLGLYMTLFVITAICLFYSRWRRVLTLSGFMLGVALILLSRSGTALLSLLICFAVFVFLSAARYGNNALATLTGLTIAGAAAAAFIVGSGEFDVGTKILAALGKDSTLTGRTTIWDFGWEQFLHDPILGVGYRAYWDSPLTSSGMLQAVMKQSLPHFHNNFLDVAVGLGSVGLLLFLVGVGSTVATVARIYMRRPDYLNLWPVLFLCHTLVSCIAEAPIYLNHSLFQTLLIVATSARRRPAS